MPELTAITAKRCPVSFDWEGESIELAYRPYSEAIEQEAREGADQWDGDSMKRLLAAVLLDWNMTEGGKPLPITVESLTPLPTELILGMFYAVTEDIRSPKLPTIRSRHT